MSTRNEVLKILESCRGEPVSGGFMARKIGVTRNSVWKAVEKLRSEGYTITGGSGIGYKLEEDDILSAEGILTFLSGKVSVQPRIICYDCIDSTNKEAKRIALEDPDCPVLIVADEQTGGSGRNGRPFWSPGGSGLYMSFLLRPDFEIGKAPLLTTSASVAVCEAIEAVTGNRCLIKWVNDIYLDGRKICGILTEAVTDFESGNIQHLIVGIGINCKETALPDELQGVAGFIGGEFSRNELAAKVAELFLPMAENIDDLSFIDRYRERSMVTGKEITVTHIGSAEKRRATALGIAGNGGLIVRWENGVEETLTSGEISIRF